MVKFYYNMNLQLHQYLHRFHAKQMIPPSPLQLSSPLIAMGDVGTRLPLTNTEQSYSTSKIKIAQIFTPSSMVL